MIYNCYKNQYGKFNFIILILSILINFSCEHIPSKPIVKYDSKESQICIIQTDTAAHDSAYISIGNLFNQVIPIKDTINISVGEVFKSLDQIKVAYQLATHEYKFDICIHTSRTNDTTFIYKYKPFEIEPINIAQVISGQCCKLYDVNYKRNYFGKIRKWIFKNDLTPDSAIIERTNSILRQFNYSWTNEYSAISGKVPIVKSLSGLNFKFNTKLNGEYFYLYAYPSHHGKSIKSFVESKISTGLIDAHKSVDDVFSCSNSGGSGPNVLFMIGIDKNWKYEVLPVGMVVIDDIAPSIKAKQHSSSRLYSFERVENSIGIINPFWPLNVILEKENILIDIPDISDINSSVHVEYGSFQGNDYLGYNIPFYIAKNGDVKSITIGSHKLNAQSIKNGECIRLHIKGLHIGDNSLPISAIDLRGNVATSSLSIPIVSSRDDNLIDRINDIENRINDLE